MLVIVKLIYSDSYTYKFDIYDSVINFHYQ